MSSVIKEWIISYPAAIIFLIVGLLTLYNTFYRTERKFTYELIEPYYNGLVGGFAFLIISGIVFYLRLNK